MEKIICSAPKNLIIWTVLFVTELYKKIGSIMPAVPKYLLLLFLIPNFSALQLTPVIDSEHQAEFSAQFLLYRFCRCHSCKSVTRSAPCASIINRELLSHKGGKIKWDLSQLLPSLDALLWGSPLPSQQSGFLSGNRLTHLQMPSLHSPHPNGLN